MSPHPVCRECGAPATHTVRVHYTFGTEYPKPVCEAHSEPAEPHLTAKFGEPLLHPWEKVRAADVARAESRRAAA